jgi:hypothetical protein
MKKILLVLLFLSASAFADLYVDSVYTGPKHTSAIGEESAAPKEESACVSGEKDDRGSPVRFFGEIGLLDLGVGLRFYIGETWHQYMQVSLLLIMAPSSCGIPILQVLLRHPRVVL